MNIVVGGYSLENLSRINLIVGKNGFGKSRILRSILSDQRNLKVDDKPAELGIVRLVSPERGGYLEYEPGIEVNLVNNREWESDTRRENLTTNFRQQSMAKFRLLETLVLREIEKEKRSEVEYTFDTIVDRINELLENIEIRREGTTFKIYRKNDGGNLNAKQISSGESELITIAIEIIAFQKESLEGKVNLLCLDEPDLHLHPDLQTKLADLIKSISNEDNIIFLTSHNTALISSLGASPDSHIGFILSPEDSGVIFEPISESLSAVLPIFGAHPLSRVFNSNPIILVEGEDDFRILNHAVRKSQGRIKLYPCVAGNNEKVKEYEKTTSRILRSIYDGGKGYSLIDKDDDSSELEDLDNIVRLRLECRNAENLILTEEVMKILGIEFNELIKRIEHWIGSNQNNSHLTKFVQFRDSNYDRKNFDIKVIRNDILSIAECDTDWEIIVGKAISEIHWNDNTNFGAKNSLINYLGEKFVKNIIPKE